MERRIKLLGRRSSSVVIRDLNIFGTGTRPAQADPPLVVDPNAALAGPVAFEYYQVIAGKTPQVVQDDHEPHLAQRPLDPGID